MINKEQKYMVFDVESIGLHGEGFAVGWVVITGSGERLAAGLADCHPNTAKGSDEDRKWVYENIPKLSRRYQRPEQVRNRFWREWLEWKDKGATLVADCAWPVEARFLTACVDDDLINRCWQGPYPLIDISSLLLQDGRDPLEKFPRKEDEVPEHNPLCDAIQSARILIS